MESVGFELDGLLSPDLLSPDFSPAGLLSPDFPSAGLASLGVPSPDLLSPPLPPDVSDAAALTPLFP
ncbi:MAG TPA: hypothetical protein VID19_10105 [Candidatus Eremiobacteraceae bacterium]